MKRKHIYIVLLVIVSLAVFNSFLSSPHPDGLERVAENHSFIDRARESLSILDDYSITSANNFLGTSAAGLIGVIITGLLLYFLGKILASDRK